MATLMGNPEIRRVDTGRISGVYFLCKNNRIVYIGRSINVFGRVSEHRNYWRENFDYAYFIEVDEDDLVEAEAALIRKIRPPMNYQVNRRNSPLTDDEWMRRLGWSE